MTHAMKSTLDHNIPNDRSTCDQRLVITKEVSNQDCDNLGG